MDTLFQDKTVMVIVPHEDDEVNLAGAAIYTARQNGCRVICAFVTNGDSEYPAFIRFHEAIRALGVLGVPEEDVVFLGYPDAGKHGERSPFLHSTADIFKAGAHGTTYGMENHPDFATQEYGAPHEVTRDNLVRDLKAAILKSRPDIILATNFDYHPDHRMTHLAFTRAMGEILNEETGYSPLVLSGFCYTTGFDSVPDFYGHHLLSAVVNGEKLWNRDYDTENPVLEWRKRVRFPVMPACRGWLDDNVIYRALCCHLSQKAQRRAIRVVNGDQVYWRRRTENLVYRGKVAVSSGKGAYLHDFQMMNTHHIADKAPAMEDYLWIPDPGDGKKWCRCDFDAPQHVEAVAFYGNIDPENRILKGRLTFSTGYACGVGELAKDGHETLIPVPPQDGVTWVKFEILESRGSGAGLSEWEILETVKEPFSILQICVDGNFAYDWHVWPGEKPVVSAYIYGISSGLRWYINGMPCTLEEINGKVRHLECRTTIRVESEESSLACEAAIAPADISYRLRYRIAEAKDRLAVWWENQKEKRPHHRLKKIRTEEEYRRFIGITQ